MLPIASCVNSLWVRHPAPPTNPANSSGGRKLSANTLAYGGPAIAAPVGEATADGDSAADSTATPEEGDTDGRGASDGRSAPSWRPATNAIAPTTIAGTRARGTVRTALV